MTSSRRIDISNFIVLSIFAATHSFSGMSLAASDESYVVRKKQPGSVTLAVSGKPANVYASSQDYPGVLRVLKHLQQDFQRVTGQAPSIVLDNVPTSGEALFVGTIGRSPVIDRLIKEGKVDAEGVKGKWETFLIQTVESPVPGVEWGLVIAGSDKRGTIYGIYDLSAEIGVSPWYWWADVPAKKSGDLYVRPGRYTDGEPAVKYRGLFINDEAPAFSGWTQKTFGGFNAKMYEHVFELILRLKGNFLWPAMWGRAFYDDDPENPRLADEYGVVIGTSHHEPMMRAHDEWRRYGQGGAWNYEKNEQSLKEFWKEGIRRMGSYESIVTLAMRGDGDEPMSREANVALLERIVRDQRTLLSETTGKDIRQIPQVWALYKEVQDYYDKGMRVPDDVTILLCDDNWGNIRKLPRMSDPERAGGYGIYYHFDYVGGPRNYKWLNTTQIERVWEQMHLAYEYGATRIWVVNVGDIKPMEFPISFFLEYAWNPDRWPAERLPEFARRWSEQQFGPEHSGNIAEILSSYTKFNSRRKPELLSPETYSLVNHLEAETVVTSYNEVAEKAKRLYEAVPSEAKDAFYQLVLHQPLACANLNDLYVTVGLNRLYAKQGRAATNDLAHRARELYARDSSISLYYNDSLARGKWNHMMDQTHIGYTMWQQPDVQSMPAVTEIEVPAGAEMGVAIEGSDLWWPDAAQDPVLPEVNVYGRQRRYVEVFNRGRLPFRYAVMSGQPWLRVDSETGIVEHQRRLWVEVDWSDVPTGTHRVPLTIAGPGDRSVSVIAVVRKPETGTGGAPYGFVESDGRVSIESASFSRSVSKGEAGWMKIPSLGRTGSAMTPEPVTSPTLPLGADSPRLEYDVHMFSAGEILVNVFISPLLNFSSGSGFRIAVSFDDDRPHVINIHEGQEVPDWRYPMWWNSAVSNNIIPLASRHSVPQPGQHILKIWMVDPGVVFQKMVIQSGEPRPSYLGPPESAHVPASAE